MHFGLQHISSCRAYVVRTSHFAHHTLHITQLRAHILMNERGKDNNNFSPLLKP